jgi:hypothetical protein
MLAVATVLGVLIFATPSAWAQSSAQGQNQSEEGGYVQFEGPVEVVYGPLKVILAPRATAEVRYQPNALQLSLRTKQGETRILTSARNLVMIENRGGKIEVKLPSGRVINVEPGRTEIVGQALLDDPGQIIIRLSGLGPLVQLNGGQGSQTSITLTVLNAPNPAALNSILESQPGDPNNRPQGSPLSGSSPTP